MEMMVEIAFISLSDTIYMVSLRDIKHNKKVVSMGVDIWNKRDKQNLTDI